MSITGKAPRFPQLTMADLTDAQRPLGEAIMNISRVGIAGPYNPMLRSPVFGQRMFDLLAYLRWETSVPLRLNEFTILIIGRPWRSQVEWFAHEPLARRTTGGRSHGGRRHLHHRRDAARHGRRERAARRGAAVQAGRAVALETALKKKSPGLARR
jgi:hypothetical protein